MSQPPFAHIHHRTTPPLTLHTEDSPIAHPAAQRTCMMTKMHSQGLRTTTTKHRWVLNFAQFKLPPQAHLPNACLRPMSSRCRYVNAAMDSGEHTHIPLSKLLTIPTRTHTPIPHTHLWVRQSTRTGPSTVCHPHPPIQPIHEQLILCRPPHPCK